MSEEETEIYKCPKCACGSFNLKSRKLSPTHYRDLPKELINIDTRIGWYYKLIITCVHCGFEHIADMGSD